MADTDSAPLIFAVCGKGGVGKTSVSAMIARVLAVRPGKRVLVIDADPAVGLATALGITVRKTVDDVRNGIIEGIKNGQGGDQSQLMGQIDYDILDAMEEVENLAFLAIGRPEDEGCYCRLNSFLRGMIGKLAANFDYVVIDGEAGIEQVNRRVMEMITHLLLVTDTSVKGHNVAGMIAEVAARHTACREKGLLVNKVRPSDDTARLPVPDGISVLGYIPEDDVIRDFDGAGRSFFSLPDCGALGAVKRVIASLTGDVQ
ncbi:MAG: AAA family ATPase [Thermodesulfobacteriota bacterium]|nr:AAA family ATPase [Thermodesulfobacteriota bacterium]